MGPELLRSVPARSPVRLARTALAAVAARFSRPLAFAVFAALLSRPLAFAAEAGGARPAGAGPVSRPNILLAIADDWGWPHAGAYGDPAVKTPAFDRVAREGVLFRSAFVTSPSCTPSRGALLTGQWHGRLGGAANLWSVFPDRVKTYPEILEAAGYFVGSSGKAWGPGRTETPGRAPAGKPYGDFERFLAARPAERPFAYWLGSSDPHRPYDEGSGIAGGIDPARIRVPAHLPDDPVVRSDLADYLFEVQRFDALVGAALAALERAGELDRTLVVVTSDNGAPFPRAKANLYDAGTRVPLAIRWPGKVPGGRTSDDLVSLADLAPTFLELAGVPVPREMTGRSLAPILSSSESGRVDPAREFVLVGKERHVPCQEAPDRGGYPCRAIRTHEYLYIRNYRPDRWPAGTPHHERATIPGAWYADCDNGPTKRLLVEARDSSPEMRRLYDLAFSKRPTEELYDLAKDPDQLSNVAADPKRAAVVEDLRRRLARELVSMGDPRALGRGEDLEEHPYLGGAPKYGERD